jgi:hypothetical protein
LFYLGEHFAGGLIVGIECEREDGNGTSHTAKPMITTTGADWG